MTRMVSGPRFSTPRYSRDAYQLDGDGSRCSLWRYVPGIASEFIHHLPDLLKEGADRAIVLYCRESKDNGHLANAVAHAERALTDLNRVATFSEVNNGSIYNFFRFKFEEAIEVARRHNAILVAPSRDRLIRGRDFNGKAYTERPTIGQYMSLRQMAEGVPLATILHPDQNGRASQTRRGMAAAGNMGGAGQHRTPGYKKRRRKRKLRHALELREDGLSLRAIAAELELSKSTVQDWMDRYF